MTHSSLYAWLDAHPAVYPWLAGTVIAAATGVALRSWLRPAPGAAPGSDWRWGLVLLAVLLAGRWPALLINHEFNPDESQLFAGAHVLAHDPVFGRSLDGDTAGPLDFVPLVVAGWIGGWDSYVSVRLAALGLMAASLALLHGCLAAVYPPRAVRLATLATAVFEALTNAVDLLHYSTELVPLALLSLAAYAAARRWAAAGGAVWCLVGGLALGAVPLGKLQAAPLALCAGLAWWWAEIRVRHRTPARNRTWLLAGAVLPLVAVAVPPLVTGCWDNFVTSFLASNLSYTAAGHHSLARVVQLLFEKSLEQDSLFHFWLPGMLAWGLLTFAGRSRSGPAIRSITPLAFAAALIGAVCALAARRPFLHYWQFAVPGVTLLLGALLGDAAATAPRERVGVNRWLAAAGALALLAVFGGHRLQKPNMLVGAFSVFDARTRHPIATFLLAHAQPGDTLAVWGWSNYLYVQTALRQGTREAHIARLVTVGPLQNFYRSRYLADVEQARPTFFVDSVGPDSLYFRAEGYRHDQCFPELSLVIQAEYTLMADVGPAKVYRRRDASGH